MFKMCRTFLSFFVVLIHVRKSRVIVLGPYRLGVIFSYPITMMLSGYQLFFPMAKDSLKRTLFPAFLHYQFSSFSFVFHLSSVFSSLILSAYTIKNLVLFLPSHKEIIINV